MCGNTAPVPTISIIIPTYNRKDSLLRTLESLTQQTYPVDHFEVIVVNDGGSDDTERIMEHTFPFTLHYLCQENQGATVARNYGVTQSRGTFLLFADDDICLYPRTMELLLEHLDAEKTIVLGALITPREIITNSIFARSTLLDQAASTNECESVTLPFQECMTGLMCLRHQDFLDLGMFQDPTGGWPNWDDVDFGYRAHSSGYQLVRVMNAIAEHWDYALADWQSACQRWWRASYSGARLLTRYPELRSLIPMFRDKGAIIWLQDHPRLILRKLARQIISSRPAMWVMEHLIPVLERHSPSSTGLRLLYRWVISGYIYQGYRTGLRELARSSTIGSEKPGDSAVDSKEEVA